MNKPEHADNKTMVLENLRQVSPTDSQVIEMLLLLIDDWEIRAAVMESSRNRGKSDFGNIDQTVTQTVTKSSNQEKNTKV